MNELTPFGGDQYRIIPSDTRRFEVVCDDEYIDDAVVEGAEKAVEVAERWSNMTTVRNVWIQEIRAHIDCVRWRSAGCPPIPVHLIERR